jgi:small subunit ribosomal protein S14
MAKKSAVEKNSRRKSLVESYASRRASLKALIKDRTLPAEERFQATIKLASLPRNSAQTRVRNRCEISGRPRGYYRKFRMSRIALREFSLLGMIPGMTKSSW